MTGKTLMRPGMSAALLRTLPAPALALSASPDKLTPISFFGFI
jgi:hypothetical protein